MATLGISATPRDTGRILFAPLTFGDRPEIDVIGGTSVEAIRGYRAPRIRRALRRALRRVRERLGRSRG